MKTSSEIHLTDITGVACCHVNMHLANQNEVIEATVKCVSPCQGDVLQQK